MMNLGLMAEEGKGGPVDLVTARGLFEVCAKAGDLQAVERLGLMAEEGQGGPKDLDLSQWCVERLAAARGQER
jgi:uncharacterized protein